MFGSLPLGVEWAALEHQGDAAPSAAIGAVASYCMAQGDKAPAEPPYQQRMRVELQELVTRLDALRAFLLDPVKRIKVRRGERELMFTQLNAMTVYREALASRMRLIGMEV